MPSSPHEKVEVTCPRCGHRQMEPVTAISTVCRKCGGHLTIADLQKPAVKPAGPAPAPQQRQIACYECGAALQVAVSAESTMCKRCSRYIDLKDYRITSAVSKNFKTLGTFVVEPKGYVFNTEAMVADAVIKGRFLGKLVAQRSLTIYSTAEIKGTFTTPRLVIPAANHFRWPQLLHIESAEIGGELVANLHATGTLVLTSTGRLFGDVTARNLVVHDGAILVGQMRVGSGADTEPNVQAA